MVRHDKTPAFISLTLACMIGCRCAQPPPSTVTPSATASPADTRAVDTLIHNCQEALTRVADAPAGTDQYPAFVQGCAPLHAREKCRQAWELSLPVDETKRTHFVAARCAEAYCAGLPDPRPALCRTSIESLSDDQVDQAWPALYQAILQVDLPAGRDAGLSGLLVELQRPSQQPVVELQLRPDGLGHWLVQVGRERPRRLPAPLSEGDLRTIKQDLLRARHREPTGLVVRVQEGMTDPQLAPLIQTVSQLGYDEIVRETVPAPPAK